MSVDSLSPISPTSRSEFPFHRQASVTSASGARRGSTTGSLHSIGGQLDPSGHSSNALHEVSQNAISTLLQPPIVRTGLVAHTAAPASSAHRPPTARDIPPVTLTNIPHVDSSEFKPYLSQVGALYETLRRVKESEDESDPHSLRRHGKGDEPNVDSAHLKPRPKPNSRPTSSRKASTSSINSISSLEGPALRRRSSSNFSKKATQGPPPLSTIPTVYFDEDFHLENPRTFDVVSERSEVVRQSAGPADEKNAANGSAVAPRKTLATNAILQEKLSWYMDTIEMHLIASISTASTTFFSALGSLRELHSEAAESVDRIKTLRKELEALDQEIATAGIEIVQKKRRCENLQQLNDAVQQLKAIVECVSICESQVDSGELEEALAGIESLEGLVAGERTTTSSQIDRLIHPKHHLRDLRGAVALEGVNDDINTLRVRIGKAYESNLLNILLGDIRRHVTTVSTQEVLLRWSSSAMRARGAHAREPSAYPAYLGSTTELRSQLMPVLAGLQKSKHVTVAVAAYRDLVLREIKNLVRKPLPSSNDDDGISLRSSSTTSSRHLTQQEKSSILARNLRALDEGDAEELLMRVYISVTETLRRLTTQVKVLFDVASMMGEPPDAMSGLRSPPPLKSPALDSPNREVQEEIHLTMDMANLLGQAVDIAQEKIVKVLRVRSDQSSRLPLIWFLRYFTLNLYFANECEAISGRSGTSLKTVVNSHIKDFIQLYGDAEKQKLAQGMESDQWGAKDFAENHTTLLDRIVDSSTRDAAAWSEGSKIWEPYPDEEENAGGRPRAESNGATKDKARSAVIDGESFTLPNSAILCLEGMSHFLHLISSIPSMASDISGSLIAYLQLFNSRCTQLILGAGATRSAGLKNITTRHLALAARALSFITTLIPHVREFVRRHAATGPNVNNAAVANLMGDFDRVRRLFQEHQNNIYDKSVEMMTGRAATHVKTLRALDWDRDRDSDADVPAVNLYMEALTKEIVTFHRALSKFLPDGAVQMIMVQVFSGFKTQLGEAYEGLQPEGNIGVQR